MSSQTSSSRPATRAYMAVAICTILAACGKGESEPRPASQVAVKVNGEEITVHQLNQVLSRAGALSPEQSKVANRRALEQLVDQQLLLQKATQARLDRNPEVMAAIEASKRQILAQAYMEKAVAAAVARPGAEDVRKFYEARPELFSERRIFRLQEIAANVGSDKLPALAELIGKTRNLNDIQAFLRANDIKFNANAVTRPAEQLPQDVVPMLGRMKDGEIAALRSNGRFTIVQRVSAALAPLNLEEATPAIEQFLVQQKRTELAGAELRQLRQVAKLEYVGDFAPPAAPAAAANAVPSGAVAPTAAGGATAGAGPARPATEAGPLDSAIERGLKGLK